MSQTIRLAIGNLPETPLADVPRRHFLIDVFATSALLMLNSYCRLLQNETVDAFANNVRHINKKMFA